MRTRTKVILLVATFGWTASCGYAAPYRSSGPALSKEGVEIAIAGQRCYVNRSAEQFPTTVNDDQLNLAMRLQIQNKASRPAVLSLDSFRLSQSIGGERTVMMPRESDGLSLQPGETKIVSLDFEQSGVLDCHHEMALDADGAVKMEGGQVNLDPIRFLATD